MAGLTIALVISLFIGEIFFLRVSASLMVYEVPALLALIALQVMRRGQRRLIAVGLAFVAALPPIFIGIMVAIYPGGSPGPRPPSSALIVISNLVVMVFAALQFRGDSRIAGLVATGLVIAGVVALRLLFR